jgi:hypothetical protein
MTHDDTIAAAVKQLAKSPEGRSALQILSVWFEADGLRLDHANQEAAYSLLAYAWGGFGGSVLQAVQPFRAR